MKIFGIIVIAAMTCGFMACSNSKAPATEPNKTEFVEIEQETAVDEAAGDDSLGAITRGGTEREGFGRCFENGCYCKEFKGRGQTCQNCGHAYKRHY